MYQHTNNKDFAKHVDLVETNHGLGLKDIVGPVDRHKRRRHREFISNVYERCWNKQQRTINRTFSAHDFSYFPTTVYGVTVSPSQLISTFA